MEKLKKILIINNERDNEELGWIPQLEKALKSIEFAEHTIKHYSEITTEIIEELKPQYIILAGRIGHHWDLKEIMENYIPKLKVIKDLNVPILGICAGLQLIAITFGGSIGKMIESDDDRLEEGYIEHFIKKEDTIFEGLNKSFYCRQLHRDEVKVLPDDFIILASSEMCKVQAIKHQTLPIYGFQFHPEWYNDEFSDGKRILANFLKVTP